jgi:biopolymer transport protein ExbD
MAEIQQATRVRGRRQRLPRLHIDMTPMVDLAFLLLTFFILTTHLRDQRMMDLAMPLAGPPTKADHMLTLLLDEQGRVYGYRGEFDPATTRLLAFRAGELPVALRMFNRERRTSPPTCMVKAGTGTRYGQVIEVVDEVDQAGIARLSVQDSLSIDEETLMLAAAH